jgi:hypothetical protein
MKKAEIALVIILIVGITFIFLHYPGGAMLSIITFLSLSGLYAYFGFAFFNGIRFRNITKKESYKNLNKFMIATSILTGIGFAILINGILFKLLNWTGANLMLIAGLATSLTGFLFGLYFYKSSAFPFKSSVLKRIILYTLLGLFLFYFDKNKRLEMTYKDHPAYIEAVKRSWEEPENKELKAKADLERRKMNGEEIE